VRATQPPSRTTVSANAPSSALLPRPGSALTATSSAPPPRATRSRAARSWVSRPRRPYRRPVKVSRFGTSAGPIANPSTVPVEERDLPVGLDAYRLGAQPAVRAGAPVPADEGGGQPLGEAQQSPGGYRCTTGGAQRPVACRRRGAGPGLAWHPRPLAPGCGRRGLAVFGYRASWLGCGQVFQWLRDRATAQTVSIGHVRRCHMHGASDTATSAAIRPRVPGV